MIDMQCSCSCSIAFYREIHIVYNSRLHLFVYNDCSHIFGCSCYMMIVHLQSVSRVTTYIIVHIPSWLNCMQGLLIRLFSHKLHNFKIIDKIHNFKSIERSPCPQKSNTISNALLTEITLESLQIVLQTFFYWKEI